MRVVFAVNDAAEDEDVEDDWEEVMGELENPWMTDPPASPATARPAHPGEGSGEAGDRRAAGVCVRACACPRACACVCVCVCTSGEESAV